MEALPVISIRDLEALPQDRYVNGWSTRDRVVLDLPDSPRHKQIRWEAKLNRYQTRCGCVAGAACLFVALLGGGAYLVSISNSILSTRFFWHACLLVVVSGGVALAAKLVSLAVTRVQFSLMCKRIVREMTGGSVVGEGSLWPEV